MHISNDQQSLTRIVNFMIPGVETQPPKLGQTWYLVFIHLLNIYDTQVTVKDCGSLVYVLTAYIAMWSW
jgi:hypothetical protein